MFNNSGFMLEIQLEFPRKSLLSSFQWKLTVFTIEQLNSKERNNLLPILYLVGIYSDQTMSFQEILINKCLTEGQEPLDCTQQKSCSLKAYCGIISSTQLYTSC